MRKILVAAATMLGLLFVPVAVTPQVVGMHRSCGYHCSPDNGASTDTAIVVDGIQLVRVNIHSGGRLHGSANKRVGCGGCQGHPASVTIGAAAGVGLL